jgi:hypothetical protein
MPENLGNLGTGPQILRGVCRHRYALSAPILRQLELELDRVRVSLELLYQQQAAISG